MCTSSGPSQQLNARALARAVNLLTNYGNHVAGTEIDLPVVATSEVALA